MANIVLVWMGNYVVMYSPIHLQHWDYIRSAVETTGRNTASETRSTLELSISIILQAMISHIEIFIIEWNYIYWGSNWCTCTNEKLLMKIGLITALSEYTKVMIRTINFPCPSQFCTHLCTEHSMTSLQMVFSPFLLWIASQRFSMARFRMHGSDKCSRMETVHMAVLVYSMYCYCSAETW